MDVLEKKGEEEKNPPNRESDPDFGQCSRNEAPVFEEMELDKRNFRVVLTQSKTDQCHYREGIQR